MKTMNTENIKIKVAYIVIAILICLMFANCAQNSGASTGENNEVAANNSGTVTFPKWENGEIFYAIDETGLTENDIWMITSAMNRISYETENAVVFLQVPYEDYLDNSKGILEIAKSDKDHATIGYQNDAYLYLEHPEDFGIILHELFHVIGFRHEFQRNDRDNYIIIHEENVISSEKNNFKKIKMAYDETVFSYDYLSISLYGYSCYSFSKKEGELKTIEYKEDYPFKQVPELSKMDIEKIKAVYSN